MNSHVDISACVGYDYLGGIFAGLTGMFIRNITKNTTLHMHTQKCE